MRVRDWSRTITAALLCLISLAAVVAIVASIADIALHHDYEERTGDTAGIGLQLSFTLCYLMPLATLTLLAGLGMGSPAWLVHVVHRRQRACAIWIGLAGVVQLWVVLPYILDAIEHRWFLTPGSLILFGPSAVACALLFRTGVAAARGRWLITAARA